MTVDFYSAFWIPTAAVYLQRSLVLTSLVQRETAAISARSVYTIQPCTMSRHFMQSQIRKVHACLTVTCHLHFWQNGWDLFRAAAVTRGWNEHRNKSQHRRLTVEKKILPRLLPGLDHKSCALTAELSPLPERTLLLKEKYPPPPLTPSFLSELGVTENHPVL